MSIKDYTAGAAAALADCKAGTVNDSALFGDSLYCRGYRGQWNYMTRPSNQPNFPGCLETWQQAGKARVMRLERQIAEQPQQVRV